MTFVCFDSILAVFFQLTKTRTKIVVNEKVNVSLSQDGGQVSRVVTCSSFSLILCDSFFVSQLDFCTHSFVSVRTIALCRLHLVL